MAELYFSMRAFKSRLKKARDRDPYELDLPEGVTKERADMFLRVMKAESLDEIADIPDEEIIGMIMNGDAISQMIDVNNIFSNPYVQAKLESSKSAGKRRIL